MDAVGAAGEDEAGRPPLEDLFERRGKGQDLGVDLELPKPPGDELGILASKVQYDDAGSLELEGPPHYFPMPMRCVRWKILPSVLIEGAMMISVVCISRIVEAPTEPMQVRSAPTRFCEPSSRRDGP